MLIENYIEIIYNSAASTFITVGSFVGITLFLFGYANFISKGKIIEMIEKKKKLQIFVGSFLGLTPGCGGAIIVMPLYILKKVTFGTVVATLIATMGDAAFVILVYSPKLFLLISIISFIVAIITGYLIDFLGITTNSLDSLPTKYQLDETHSSYFDDDLEYDKGLNNNNITYMHIGHSDGDIVDISLHHKSFKQNFLHGFRHKVAYKFYWILIVLGFILGCMDLMQIDLDNDLYIKNLRFIGVVGTGFSLLYTLITRKILKDDTHEETESKLNSLKETLVHNAEETAFVTTWVFMAFLTYEIGLSFLGGENALTLFMDKSGFLVVVIAIIIGIIPGCGPQIVLATLFITGTIPFSALMANAICNDGDALFPLLAVDKKSALWATLYNIIPATIVGGILYLFNY